MVQVSVSADRVSPAPDPGGEQPGLGVRSPATRPASTSDPATRRTWRSSDQRARPRTRLPSHRHQHQHHHYHHRAITAGRGGVGGDAAVEDVQAVGAGAGEALLGLGGPGAGLADQHDLAVEPGGELLGVLVDQVQRHVDRAGDAGGLELGGAADVEDGHRVGSWRATRGPWLRRPGRVGAVVGLVMRESLSLAPAPSVGRSSSSPAALAAS